VVRMQFKLMPDGFCNERSKRDVYCNKQVKEAVTVLNCMLKGSWGEGESGGYQKEIKK